MLRLSSFVLIDYFLAPVFESDTCKEDVSLPFLLFFLDFVGTYSWLSETLSGAPTIAFPADFIT